ncbi:MAG: hypothetical protein Kow00108_04300 [Calditrichia bacterium]
MKRWFVYLVILAAMFSANAQTADYVLFDQGLKFYLDKNYKAAESNFLKISSEYPDSPIITAAYLMLLRSQYHQKKYALAEASGHLLMKKYPSSRYKDDVYYWLGNIKFQLKQYQKGVLYWLLSFKETSDKRLKKILSSKLNKAMTNVLSDEDLKNLAERLDDDQLKILVQISHAKVLIRNREYTEAYGILKNIKNQYPDNPFQSIINTILEDIPFDQVITGKYILLSMPQAEELDILGKTGSDFIQGFKFGYNEFKKLSPESEVNLVTIDDSNSVVAGAPKILETISKYDIWAAVGSLTDEMTGALELIFKYNNIPLIAPTAKHKNLKKIFGKYIQINPDPFMKGKILGNYTRSYLKHDTIATMAPLDEYGKQFINGFKSAFSDSDSVFIISEEYFVSNANQFLQQFKNIRFKALFHTFKDSVLNDSINMEDKELTDEELLSMYQVWLDEKVEKMREELGKNVDSLDIPVENIDVLVAAIYPEQIPSFSSQFAYFNLKTQLVGNEGWYDIDELDKVNSTYINNLIFITPIFIQDENWDFKNFKNKFRQSVKTTPNKFHLLGYNLSKWLCMNVEASENKSGFLSLLLSENNTQMIGMNLKFSSNSQTNEYLNIVQYKFGKFFKIR